MNSQFWPQPDGSIVDKYWRRISRDEKESIIETIHSLPAREKYDDFLYALERHKVVIVQWETWSGKTTQLPKFAHQKNPHQKIVVTQPRVLSAKSNAWRVSDELLVETWDAEKYSLWIGVGYRTWPEKNSTKDTNFLFNTDATEVLRQAISGLVPQVLFLDEVHNFSIPTEVVAMLARKRADAMKIVIMSATLDPAIFQEYFKEISTDIPFIQIPGRTFWVQAKYDAPGSYMVKMRELVKAKKNILFFAPWKKEIDSHIEDFQREFSGSVLIFPLHSEMPRSEQDKLLRKDSDKPYIIVSTNVAEESITIPYIDAVIDLWTHKVIRYDKFGNPILNLEDTAYANAKQRAGRAWRTKPGEYFRFNFTPSSELLDYPEAPIEKEMIDRHILALLSQWTNIIHLIEEEDMWGKSPFFHSVNKELFTLSLSRLQDIGALTSDLKLTELGYELLKFPVDVYHARMLYEAISRNTLDSIIPLVAILEKKWFVSKDAVWKELLTRDTYASDLLGYYELFQIITSTTLSKKHERFLIEHGADPYEIADFRERDNGIKLYEVVDLACIGIKNKKVKEIDEAVFLLRKHIEWMINEDITRKSQDAKSIKISLASGYMHAIYVYDQKTKKFYNKDQKNGPWFNLWNVSLIEPVHGKLYLWIPFIIGWSEAIDDFPILTHVVSVDEQSIKEAHAKSVIYAKQAYVSKEQSTSYSPAKSWWHQQWVHGENTIDVPHSGVTRHVKGKEKLEFPIVVDYDWAIHEFQHERHETSEDAKLFYLRYCLIPFLCERNKHIRNYIAWKDEDWIQYFSMLLRSFLEKHDLYRINPKNIARTEASFRDDADILRRFQDSPDPGIRMFRLKWIPTKVTEVLDGTIVEATIWRELNASHPEQEINQLRSHYKQLMGEIKLYSRPIALGQIEAFALRKRIEDIATTPEYAELYDIFHGLSKYSTHELQEMMKYLKWLRNKKRDEKKALTRLSELERFQEIFKNEESLSWAKDSVLLDALKNGYFWHMDAEEVYGYKQFVRRIKSKDSRQRKRAMRENWFSYYQSRLNRHIQAEKRELELLKQEIALENIPEAAQVLSSIEKIGNILYKNEYYRVVLHDGNFDFMRSILRDGITEKKWIDALLFDWFFRTWSGVHMKNIGEKFTELVNHIDLMDIFEDSYGKWSKIYDYVMNPHSLEQAYKHVKNLSQLVEKMRESSRVIDRSKLFQAFHGQ